VKMENEAEVNFYAGVAQAAEDFLPLWTKSLLCRVVSPPFYSWFSYINAIVLKMRYNIRP